MDLSKGWMDVQHVELDGNSPAEQYREIQRERESPAERYRER